MHVVFATPSMHVPPFKHGKSSIVPFNVAAITESLKQRFRSLHFGIFNEEKLFLQFINIFTSYLIAFIKFFWAYSLVY